MPQRLQDGGTRRKLGLCLPKGFEGLFDSLSIRVAYKVHGISTSRAHRVHTGGAERVQTLPVNNRSAGGIYPHDPLEPVCSRVALPIGQGTVPTVARGTAVMNDPRIRAVRRASTVAYPVA